MWRTSRALLLAAVLCLVACAAAPPETDGEPKLIEVAGGFSSPVSIAHAGDDRLFIVEKGGTISILQDGAKVEEPFLDIRGDVSTGGEQGLLGLAFPEDFGQTGLFYVYYTDTNGDSVLSRFASDGQVADRASEQVLLTQSQPFGNHNGGQLAFGPDGYLYLGLGDGGSGGDPQGNGQALRTLLGKLLRVDVSGEELAVPPDNPFVATEGARPEIWAYGLRNPWRFSFDRETGDLYIADVGQNAFEEVNFQPATSTGGENYGWKIMEADACFEPRSGCDQSGLVLPIIAYPHGGEWGSSISGGYLYRGAEAPALQGSYVFGDYVSGRIWRGDREGDEWQVTPLFDPGFNVSTFGEDAAGELYVADYRGGVIYRIGQ
ncbi:MAG TPA: PQQ-dependent sugar dehydrogenase [Micromonosporaceae bacterium]|nr:PQQ-dependent sugar dehydrogenase [Micromonosporaceae bacterium]